MAITMKSVARIAVLSALALALPACGSGGGEKKAKAPPPPASIPAGQWTSQLHVTSYQKKDEGRPGFQMEQGQQITGGACVGQSEPAALPPPELFVGEDFDCTYMTDTYLRNGRINAFLTCRRPGVAGDIGVGVDGQFTAEEFQGLVTFTTALVGDGDFVMSSRLTGRRTGACQAPTSAGTSNSTGN